MNLKSGWWLFLKNSFFTTYTPVAQDEDPSDQQEHSTNDLGDIEHQFSDSDSDDNEIIIEMKHRVADIATMEESYEVRFCIYKRFDDVLIVVTE